jgi:hypothetical protein
VFGHYLARVLAVAMFAIVLGLALSVVLLGTTERYGGYLGGEWWIPLFAATSITLGWVAGRVVSGVLALVAALAAPPLAIATMIAVKVLRWPAWPAVGDGFELIVASAASVGLAGAILARVARWSRFSFAGRWLATLAALTVASVAGSLWMLLIALLVGPFVGAH